MWSGSRRGKCRPPAGARRSPIPRTPVSTGPSVERAFLVSVGEKGRSSLLSPEESLEELALLTRTAGAEVVGKISQRLERTSNHYLGKGKLEDLKRFQADAQCSLVIFDDELTPTQQRNLEDALGTKVIDRTALILDIFSRHARTHEGQLQVELAQHEYLLPRLAGQWSHLERLGGGIGTRGPGETQLETDRRLIRRRIQKLQQQLKEVRARRVSYMSRRKQARLAVVSLVGYTNAGKSTLFNALSDAGVAVHDQLFSTLDPVTRRIWMPTGGEVLLTDTVGFINKLPPLVVAAFRATLQELHEADLLLHVIDITHPKAPEHTEVVEHTLEELGLAEKPRLLVVNKMDLLVPRDGEQLRSDLPAMSKYSSVLVSAALGWNLDGLLSEVESHLRDVGASRPPARVV